MANVQTTGIMFSGLPTVDAAHDSWNHPGEEFSAWRVVCYDPRVLSYGDDDQEAMDETNYEALLDSLGVKGSDLPVLDVPFSTTGYSTGEGYRAKYDAAWGELVAEAMTVGAALLPSASLQGWHSSARVLIINGEDEDKVEAAEECEGRLSDYPLLDEDSYSTREWHAWEEYAPIAWEDECRDIRRAIMADDTIPVRVQDEYEAIVDAIPADLMWEAQSLLHYNYGFSGDYYPRFAAIIRDTLGCGDGARWMDDTAKRMRDVLGGSAVRIAEVLTVMDRYADAAR